ncbi:MAG TPA: pyridoxamine 5'-phosphate oxidase family protein, partial [Tepidiformaceae bacterium]
MFEPWQRELFETSRVGRLATIARDGSPHVVPVCYAMVGDQFVIAVDEKPKRSTRLARLANIERDHRVSLLVDHYED